MSDDIRKNRQIQYVVDLGNSILPPEATKSLDPALMVMAALAASGLCLTPDLNGEAKAAYQELLVIEYGG